MEPTNVSEEDTNVDDLYDTGKLLRVSEAPITNFVLTFGEPEYNLSLHLKVRKTLRNRLKWWCFCRVFPCRIKEWKDE